jgi:hypothetical protein
MVVTTPYGSRAEGFWNDAGVSSHTTRSVHAQQRDKLKTTPVSHGTTSEHGSIFPSDPTPENPAKRSFVENVQENAYLFFLRGAKVELLTPPHSKKERRFHPPG